MRSIGKKLKFYLPFMALLAALFLCIARPATAKPTNAELKAAITQVLRENPEIIFEVLREHSEELLDVAQKGVEAKRNKAIAQNWDDDANQPKNLNLRERAVRGPQDAPVTIVAFSDFLCSYCERATWVVEDVQAAYPKEVRFIFKNYPLAKIHPFAEISSKYFIAASLQSPEKAFRMHDELFKNQARLAKDGEDFLKLTAQKVGLDVARLTEDANGGKIAALLAEDRAEAKRLGIKGTPFLVVNDLLLPGTPDKDILTRAVQKALAVKQGK